MEKHYLASANTCSGFKNCFEYINPSKNAFTYILKGGPGTGKSTIMKNFAKKYKELGYDVELFYCSSDINSLDGVRIPKKHIAIVDGTAPHITEATMPAIKEKILNVGAFIKEDIKVNKEVIEKHLNKKNYYYTLAYSYLKTAGQLLKTEQILYKKNKIENKEDSILKLDIQNSIGSERKLFNSFFSINGIEFLYKENKFKNKIILKGSLFENYEKLEVLRKKLNENNYNIVCFLSLFNPQLIEAIYIEELKIIIMAFDPEQDILNNFKNKTIFNKLIKEAGENIAKAKYHHLKVEKYYVKYSDFKAINNFIKDNIK